VPVSGVQERYACVVTAVRRRLNI